MKRIVVKSRETWIHPWSIVGYCLPTMSKARVKTVYLYGLFKIARYVMFNYIDSTTLSIEGEETNYKTTYIRVK